LLHGGGLDSAGLSWKHVLPELAADYRVYAPDWPGYGESDLPDGPVSVAYYVGVLGRFLDALDLESASLVGISMGGGAALGFAIQTPDRVDRLVAVDSYGLGGTIPGGPLGYYFVRMRRVTDLTWRLLASSRRATALALRAVVAPGNLSPALVTDVQAELDRRDAGRAWNAFQQNEVGRRGLRTNYLDDLSDLDVETLLVHGERDSLVSVSWAVRAHALLPQSSLRVLGDCGHWPPRERPETFVRVVREFLG
jgi:pimeloyl-ACP methyl ester carboxylesterase